MNFDIAYVSSNYIFVKRFCTKVTVHIFQSTFPVYARFYVFIFCRGTRCNAYIKSKQSILNIPAFSMNY